MKRASKLIIIFVTVILLLGVGVVGIIMLPWNAMFWYSEYIIPDPSKPQITREKFPFKLTYELNGEKIVIEDTMICEYVGNEWDGVGDEKSRIWCMKLKSGGDTIDLWEGYNKGKKQKIIWGVSPEYYMGDVNDAEEHRKPNKDECLYPGMTEEDFYNHYIELQTMDLKDDVPEEEIIDKKKLLKYGIKILSWECKKPIENTFVD